MKWLRKALENFDSYLGSRVHMVVQSVKIMLTKSIMLVAQGIANIRIKSAKIIAACMRLSKSMLAFPLNVAKLCWKGVLAFDRYLWRCCNAFVSGVVWIAKAPVVVVKYLTLIVLEVANKVVQFINNAVYGFMWVVKLPYNCAVISGRVLAFSYAHTGNYIKNIIDKIKAFFARIMGYIRTVYTNIKQKVFDKKEVHEMWNASNAKVDSYVKEAETMFAKDGVVPDASVPYSKHKAVLRMILMRLYARIHLNGKRFIEKFENVIKDLSHEYHRIMSTVDKHGEHIHSPVYKAINNRPKRAVMVMFGSMIGLLIVFLCWAAIFEVKGYVHAIGRIETYDQLQTIIAYDGAIVEKVMVEEDQIVHKGQELIRFDNTVFKAKYNDLQDKYYTRIGNIAVLEARIYDSPLKLDESIKEFSPRMHDEILASYQAGLNVNNTNLAVIDTQITHKEKEIEDAKRDKELYVQHIDLVNKQVDILTKLAANELVSKLRLIEVQKEMLTTQIKLKAVETDLLRSQADLKGLQDRRANYISNFHKDMLNELSVYRNELSTIIAEMASAKDQLSRTVITSPIDGTVYKISTKAVVGHTVSAQEVISIVPSSGGLVMTGLVLPSEIGFIKKGQPVSIKVATYDYSIYGSLKGIVERISPETMQNKTDGIYYYEVVVTSEHNYLEHKGRKLYIKPGMDATADFELDSRTVMHYIFDPFVKAMNESLSER